MDDLTITATTHIQARWILTALEELTSWARMKFKSAKSQYMVIKNGRLTTRFRQDEDIPSIEGNPIKCLGKWHDDTLQDVNNSKRLEDQVKDGLKNIDRYGLPGKFKAWLLQHVLLPRLTWPLMLYEINLTTVESVERKINQHLRKWLGVPQCFLSVGVYPSRSADLQSCSYLEHP